MTTNSNRAPTLQDVADALKVSKGTVSMGLKGNPVVAKQTREAIVAKADELGYVYNRGAASLSTGVTGLVGLAVHNLTNPYFTRVCASIEDEIAAHGQIALLCNLNESLEKQARFIKALEEQNADGLIICPAAGTTSSELPTRLRNGSPVVLFARDIDGVDYDFVGNDDTTAMRIATRHIIEAGHARIAYIGAGDKTSVARLRRSGFLLEMNEAGLCVDPDLMIDGSIYPESGVEATAKLMALSNPPTAIICFTDFIAMSAVSKLHEMGLVPGKDIAIIGCDGIPEGARAYVSLSTVSVQKRKLGQKAAELLHRRLAFPDAPPKREITPPVPIFRTSTGKADFKRTKNPE